MRKEVLRMDNQQPPFDLSDEESFVAWLGEVGLDVSGGLLSTSRPFIINVTPPPRVVIQSIKTPDTGWLVAMYCPMCKETVYLWDRWGINPTEYDYFKMNGVCGSDVYGSIHNLKMSLPLRLPSEYPISQRRY